MTKNALIDTSLDPECGHSRGSQPEAGSDRLGFAAGNSARFWAYARWKISPTGIIAQVTEAHRPRDVAIWRARGSLEETWFEGRGRSSPMAALSACACSLFYGELDARGAGLERHVKGCGECERFFALWKRSSTPCAQSALFLARAPIDVRITDALDRKLGHQMVLWQACPARQQFWVGARESALWQPPFRFTTGIPGASCVRRLSKLTGQRCDGTSHCAQWMENASDRCGISDQHTLKPWFAGHWRCVAADGPTFPRKIIRLVGRRVPISTATGRSGSSIGHGRADRSCGSWARSR